MTIDRRNLLRSGLAFGMAAIGPMSIWGCVARGERSAATQRQIDLLAAVGDLVFPQDDMPAASALGVHDFVALALQHGLDGTLAADAPVGEYRPRPHLDGLWLLDDFAALLDGQAGGDFATAPAERQQAVLTAVDKAAFAPGGEASPWHVVKDLIVIGYCTSEAGGSRYLQYELVPGRWDPDLPLPADNRAWSSDWTARDFG